MVKIVNLLVCMSMALFGSSQSASFNCKYHLSGLGNLPLTYQCAVQNAVNITSLDAAQVDGISGTHLPGYYNDNVEAFTSTLGQIHYFPRGLNRFFKNLKGLQISSSGLKEVHQSDLKDHTHLKNLFLSFSDLEILEENLFEFNPNLEMISLGDNKITHIHANVLDKLNNLKYLYFEGNPCISVNAINDPSSLKNVIKKTRTQCVNSEYSNLYQKVKNLEIESKNLFSEKLQNLENEIKMSKFSNFFQTNLQVLKSAAAKNGVNLNLKEEIIKDTDFIKNAISGNDQKLSKFIKDTTTTLKDVKATNDQNFVTIMRFIENTAKKLEAIDEKLAGIDIVLVKLMNKINKIEPE
ncbi:unnamed protein product [Chironomus riparius]|uniref:Uncharacterized protein n=1 Tax=Chironomus riparius TaxID=315576 RepID=A0A9N9S6Y5_9DIPT|nr:unnamed protein product [Chironomus riparius]